MLSDLFCKFSAMLGIMRHRIIPILLPPIPGQHGLSHNSARPTGYKAYPLKTRVSLIKIGFLLKYLQDINLQFNFFQLVNSFPSLDGAQ